MHTLAVLALTGCLPTDWDAQDRQAWESYQQTPIQLDVVVDSPTGPVTSAVVQVAEQTVSTDSTGQVSIPGLQRHNLAVTIRADGFHPIVRPIWLTRPLDEAAVSLSVTLDPIDSDVARLVFGGDVMFGRRFVDVDGNTPRDQPYPQREGALVPASDPQSGARDVLSRIEPVLSSADLASVNFESPFVRTPNTPHPEKDFVFYSDPSTLAALPASGIDFIGLGNNHVYDYLQDGLRQTLDTVDAAQMPFAGAGTTPFDAWSPWESAVRDVPMAWFAATSIDGWRWDPANSYVADVTKGGAANLADVTDMHEALERAATAGQYSILQVHTGVEYAIGPSTRVREHVDNALAGGADLIIGHHPHTAQGFSELDGTFVAWSLGNLAFDGLRLETLLGAVVEVDFSGTWEAARVYPVYLEDFRPRMMVGPDADRAFRQLSEFSEGLAVIGDEGVGRVIRTSELAWDRRTITVPFTTDLNGIAVVDLRDHAAPDESVLSLDADAPTAQVRFGRDLMGHSQFEDFDVDEDAFEVSRWDHTPISIFPCRTRRTGVAGLCSVRAHTDLDISVSPFRNRIRVFGDAEGTPEKNLSLLGWQKADGSGEVDLRVEYQASFGETVFGQEVVGTLPGGTFDWTPFRYDFEVPADLTPENNPEINPRALRLYVDHLIPRTRGAGQLALDDLAVVGWSNTPQDLPTTRDQPHSNDFLKISAPPGNWIATVELGRARQQ